MTARPASSVVFAATLGIAPTLAQDARAPAAGAVTIERRDDGARATLSITWPNAFRNERNHDGAWVVLRGPDARTAPLRLAASGHRADGDVPAELTVGDDRLGVFVAPAAAHRGDVSWQLSLALEANDVPHALTAWAVAMVFVPAGGYELGDDDPTALRFGAFHRVGDDGAPAGPLRVEDEREIPVAREAGALWYSTGRERYRGDQAGPIPASYPKGTRAFWVMKHELTQGFYAAFLNALPAEWQARRAPVDLDGKETETCSIERIDGRFRAKAPERPCNFVSWDDTCALFDWLALRPMTEFEFEKAARGPVRPVPGDYPWGTASVASLERSVQRSRDLLLASADDERDVGDETKAKFGASYYWVMDLSGSVWERVVSAGHPAGRAFRGTHGDGVLSEAGDATNDDWPKTDAEGEHAGGVGYRGGAEYFAERDPRNPTNPNSPVAVRTYGGWGGASRYGTYSARACRSVDARSR